MWCKTPLSCTGIQYKIRQVQREIQNNCEHKSQNNDCGGKSTLRKKCIKPEQKSQQETDIADERHPAEK